MIKRFLDDIRNIIVKEEDNPNILQNYFGFALLIFNILVATGLAIGVILLSLVAFVPEVMLCIYNAVYNLCYRKIMLRKELNKEILAFEESLNKKPALFLKAKNKLFVNKDKDFKEFLFNFFYDYNGEYETYQVNIDSVYCSVYRRRSTEDIYRITKEYYPEITLKEVLKCLVGFVKTNQLNVIKCSDIHKYVFRDNAEGYGANRTSGILEFSTKNNFKDLMTCYG